MSQLDCIISVEEWFDGHSLSAVPVSIGIQDGRIVHIGEVGVSGAIPTWTFPPGSILAPGFINTHSHSDFALVDDPRAVGSILQGITTEVIGHCGFSGAPLPRPDQRKATSSDPTHIPTSTPTDWETFAEYRGVLASVGLEVNVVPFVGHNTLMITSAATGGSIPMALELALTEGARGLTTGLSYHPGHLSSDRDVAALVEVAESRALPYHTHMRYSADETEKTLRETLALLRGRASRPNISHVFPRLRDHSTTVERLLLALDDYDHEFDSLTFDIVPSELGGTPWTHGLPDWAVGDASDDVGERLTDPFLRDDIVSYLREEQTAGWIRDWEQLRITKLNRPENRHLLGRTIGAAAAEEGVAPEIFALDLVVADGHYWVSPPNKRWRDVLTLASDDRCIPIVDGLTVDPRSDTLVALDRSWNAFRRFLGPLRADSGMSLESALGRLTGWAANRVGLHDRGRVAVHAVADLVVLTPDNVRELEAPEFTVGGAGIDAVMVGGEWSLIDGELRRGRRGQVL